jgi:hypothetical protein
VLVIAGGLFHPRRERAGRPAGTGHGADPW